MGSGQSETLQTAERYKDEVRGVLRNKWNILLWEPEISDQSKKVAGLEVKRIEHSLYYYVNPTGKILTVDEEKSITTEVGINGYVLLASEAENKLDALYKEQKQELENDPDGREILWRPGQYRFRHFRSPYDPFGGLKRTDVIKVRAKKDGLYCPKHTDSKLVTVVARTQDLEKFSDCPRDDCGFSVFSGT